MSISSGYYRWPSLHKNIVVFVSEDVLWKLDIDTMNLSKLTESGRVSYPRISPDGKFVAYVSNDEGDNEIYLVHIDGGPVNRLTYEGSNPRVVLWDGEDIIYTSNFDAPLKRRGESHLRKINRKNFHSTPLGYGIGHSIALGASREVVIGRNTNEPARWKRYRGGTAGEIWIDLKGDNKFKKLVTLKSNLCSPMWISNRIYFISDHEGIGNIYSSNKLGRDITKHTAHKTYYVRNASSYNNKIVYHAGGDLYIFDVKKAESYKLEFQYNSTKDQIKRKFVSASMYLQSASIDNSNTHISIASRGKLFMMGLWSGHVRQLGDKHGVRYQYPVSLSCGKKIAVVSDKGGNERIEIRNMSNGSIFKVIKNDLIGRPYMLLASPNPKIISVINHRNQIIVIDTHKDKVTLVDRSEFHPISGMDFSKHGRYLAYSCSHNSKSSVVKIFDFKSNKAYRITTPILHDVCPSFDPSGKYLYCISARTFNPVYDGLHFDLNFPKGTKPYLIVLDSKLGSPFLKQPEPYYPIKTNDKKKNSNKVDREIDFDGIMDRMIEFPVSEGKYEDIQGGNKGRVFYTTSQIKGSRDPGWYGFNSMPGDKVLYYYDLETLEQKKFMSDISDFELSEDKKTVLVRIGNKLSLYATDAPPTQDALSKSSYSKSSGKIDLSRISVEIDQVSEWRQMYSEAWRLQRDYFWVKDMSKIDWLRVYDRYFHLIDRLGSRSEFSDLIWEMQGELGTSHAYEFGGDYEPLDSYNIGFLGCDYIYNDKINKFEIKKIFKGDIWDGANGSPLMQSGAPINEGSFIEEINGRKINLKNPPGKALLNMSGKRISIKIRSCDDNKIKSMDLVTLRNDSTLRYRDWVEMNRRYVHKKSNNKIGYVHIPDMGPEGYAEFHRYFLTEVEFDSLIVDVRFNGGGHVSQLILEKLARKRMGYGIGRWMGAESYPSEAVEGQIIAITNEYAGSDGDIFSHTFKLMKLGKLIGKRTWGGVIGIWPRNSLVDGTITTQPEYSFWFNDVGWDVENYGTDVDIEVHNSPLDFMNGKDSQLDRAILELQKSIKKNPVKRPRFSNKPNLKLPK